MHETVGVEITRENWLKNRLYDTNEGLILNPEIIGDFVWFVTSPTGLFDSTTWTCKVVSDKELHNIKNHIKVAHQDYKRPALYSLKLVDDVYKLRYATLTSAFDDGLE